MVTSGIIFALIGFLLFKFANSAAIDYEPIKIIVNENFNAQPGQVSSELQTFEPRVLHQGANFYFKPQVNLPQSVIPSHIEALISFIQQHQNSWLEDSSKFAAEKDKLMEILKAFIYSSSDTSKETPSKIVFEKETNLEIVKPPEFIPPTLEKIVAEPHPVPVINTEEPKPVTELLVIPEAPRLSPLLLNVHPLVEKEVKNDGSAILQEQRGVYPTIPEITVRPIQEPIFNYVQTKSMTSELVNIPEAPVLPSLSFNGISSNVKKEKIKEESVITETQKEVFPTISEIAVRPIQETIINYDEFKTATSEFRSIPDAFVLSQNDNSNPEEPIINNVEPKTIIAEIEILPEAPVLSPLILQDVPSIVKEEVKNEESLILKEQTDVFPIISEIAVRPVQESIFNYVEPKPFITELQVISEAPILPPFSANDIELVEEGMKTEEPIVVEVETKPAIQEIEEVISEAPVVPPLSIHDMPYIVKEEVRKEESVLLKKSTDVFSTVPEAAVKPIQEHILNYAKSKPFIAELQVIPEAPVLPPLSAKYIKLVEEGMKIEEPIVVDVESKHAIQELEEVIPEALVSPPLIHQDVPFTIKEEVRKEESEILKEPTVVFPVISEIAARPIQEPIFDYVEPKPFITEIQVISEAPALSPLSTNDIKLVAEGLKIKEPIVVEVETKPAVPEIEEVIPEAPVLPPLSLHDVPYIVKEEVRKEESELLRGPTDVSSTVSEAAVRPVQVSTFNYAEPKPFIREFPVIPEAPLLPPLSVNDIKLIEEGMEIEEPIVVNVESNPAIQELEKLIPEAPVLSPLILQDVPSIIKEEVKKEESLTLKEPTEVFPIISEIAVRPVQEPIFNYVEPKTFITEFQVIPEAPVLPPQSVNDIKLVEEGIKIEEPIVVNVESNPAIQELEKLIPEAPVLSPLILEDVPSIKKEEVKKEESLTLKEPTEVFPIISEIAVRPVQEPIFNYVEPKTFITEFQVIPEAPVLPPLSANDIKLVEEGIKIEEPIVIDVESKPAIQELEKLIPEAPMLSPLILQDVPSIIKEEVKNEESLILKEPTDVFPTISGIAVRPVQEPIFNYVEPKPFITEFQVIPEAPVLPPLSANDIKLFEEGIKIVEPIVVESKPSIQGLEEVISKAPVLSPLVLQDVPSNKNEKVRKEESEILKEPADVFPRIPEISARPISEPITVKESTKHFSLENNNSPVATKVNIEIPILEESIEVFPSITERPLRTTLEPFPELEMTNSYVLEEVSEPKPEHMIRVKPLNNLRVFSYAPFVSNRAAKTKKLTIPKPAPLERFLLKNHPFSLPVMSFPKLSLNEMKFPIRENKKQFLYPTSFAHDVVEKRITPNMAFKKYAPPKLVKIYVRSQLPKGPSYL